MSVPPVPPAPVVPPIVPPSIPVPVLSEPVVPIGEPFVVVESVDVDVELFVSPHAASVAQSAKTGIILKMVFIVILF
jgi:hypothetical protein